MIYFNISEVYFFSIKKTNLKIHYAILQELKYDHNYLQEGVFSINHSL